MYNPRVLILLLLDLDEFVACRSQQALGEFRAVDQALDQWERAADPFSMENQATGDQHGMRNHGAASGAHVDLAGASRGMQTAESLHL